MEPMVTQPPLPRRTRWGTRARVTKKGAMRFTAMVRVKSSGVVSATGLMKKMPALFTTMSGTPRSVRTRPTGRSPRAPAVDQPQEFVPGLRVLEQRAPQGARDRLGVLLLDAAHHHAEMVRLDHHTHAARVEHFHER